MAYWKKGQSGNPAGKPKGAKNKNPQAFKEGMFAAHFAAGGWQRVAKLAKESDDLFVALTKMIIPMVPKELKHDVTNTLSADDRAIQIAKQFIAELNRQRPESGSHDPAMAGEDGPVLSPALPVEPSRH